MLSCEVVRLCAVEAVEARGEKKAHNHCQQITSISPGICSGWLKYLNVLHKGAAEQSEGIMCTSFHNKTAARQKDTVH